MGKSQVPLINLKKMSIEKKIKDNLSKIDLEKKIFEDFWAMLKACTPSGIMEMFDYYDIDLQGKNVVMINRSNLIGKPLYHLLLEKNATVNTCHSKRLLLPLNWRDIYHRNHSHTLI